MTTTLRQLAGRLGNPLERLGDADAPELIARAEHLAEMTERTVRLARTVLHASQDERLLSHAVNFSYTSMIDATANEVAEFRSILSAIKTAIPTH